MIQRPLLASGDLSSTFTTALTGRAIALMGEDPNEIHPNTAVAATWRKVSGATKNLLSELRRLEGMGSNRGSADPSPIQTALKAVLYDATEAFDLYQQAIPKRLEAGRPKKEVEAIRAHQAAGKRLRSPFALMCNRLKHDHREIGTCLIRSRDTGASTWVFRIAANYGDLQTADRDIHPKVGFISYERILHEVMHGLLRIDHSAGQLVSSLADNVSEAITLAGSSPLGLADVLSDIGQRRPVCATDEPGLIDGIRVAGQVVDLARIVVTKVPEPTQRTMSARADEVARNIQMFR